MKILNKVLETVVFVSFLCEGQLFGGGFDAWVYAEWLENLKKSTQAPIENKIEGKLQKIECQSKEDLDEGYTCFDGEIELSGMLVREQSEYFGDIVYLVIDENFRLPARSWEKPSSAGAVLLIADSALLPRPLQKRILSGVGIRAKIKIKDYKYLHKTDYYMINDIYPKATLIEATPFENAKYLHSPYVLRLDEFEGCVGRLECDSCVYYGKWAYFKSGAQNNLLVMHYNSKDSFVNLRDKPNGNIITKIYAKDMKCGKEKGKIYVVDEDTESQEQLMNGKKKWLRVFYLPTIEIIMNENQQYIDVSKAIFGYIHSSQLKISCK